MRLMSLFAGIGGFDLAARWMGWPTAVMVEWDDFARQVLIKNFKCVPVESLSAAQLADIIRQWKAWRPGQPQPPTVLYGDICRFDARPWLGAIDLVCGGFPCQPFSSAGAGLGVEDARHLWPQMLRIICEVRPGNVLGENVRGLLTKHPLQFQAVCADLEAQGYDVQPFLFPAAGVGAPHERYRFWFVAHAHGAGPPQSLPAGITTGTGLGAGLGDAKSSANTESRKSMGLQQPGIQTNALPSPAAHAPSLGCEAGGGRSLCERGGQGGASQRDAQRAGLRCPVDGRSEIFANANGHQCRPVGHLLRRQSNPAGRIARFRSARAFRLTEPALRRADDGIPAGLVRAAGNSQAARKLARRIEKLDSHNVRAALKAYGNAIVPQVAYQFFRAMTQVKRGEVAP